MKTMLKKMFLTKHSPFRLAYQKLAKNNRSFNPFENVKNWDELIETANQIRDLSIKNPKIKSLYLDVVNSHE